MMSLRASHLEIYIGKASVAISDVLKGLRLPRRSVASATALLAMTAMWLFSGCQAHQLPQSRMERLLAAHPFGSNEAFQIMELNRTDDQSVHLVRIRTQEKPHRHMTHDVTVVIQKGEGTLYLNNQGEDLHPGDVVTIPRGLLHYYVNRSVDTPTEAVAVYSPPFDGKDIVLETGSR